MEELISNIVFEYSYFKLYFLVFGYFILLYFGLAPLFLKLCKFLASKKLLHKIVAEKVKKDQIRFELHHSFKSIVIFGFSAFPVVYVIREGLANILPDTLGNVLLGLLYLTIWNEVHFFIVHRMMHLPFFMKNVHKVHHQSVVPTVYSVYSFHWVEAALLSTVPFILLLLIPLAPLSIFLFPFVSIMLNFAGHCNYRFGNGEAKPWKLLGTYHNQHHYNFKKNYGFASHLLDALYRRFKTLFNSPN